MSVTLELDALRSANRGGQALGETLREQFGRYADEMARDPQLLADPAAGSLHRRIKRCVREFAQHCSGVVGDLDDTWTRIVAGLPYATREAELDAFTHVVAAANEARGLVEQLQWLMQASQPLEHLRTPDLLPEVDALDVKVGRILREAARAVRARTEPLAPGLLAQLAEVDRPGRQVKALTYDEAVAYVRAKRAAES